MKNRILIEDPVIEKNKITCSYKVEGPWKEAFKEKNSVAIEYNIDVSKVPQGIAVVPFLANVLPMAWVYDAEIVVSVCDKAFYGSIPEFKKGYREMYPMMALQGTLTTEKLEENIPKAMERSGAFFSGGVDAFNTLVCHASEKPVLLTLWGADVQLSDEEGWKNVLTHLQETSKQFAVDYVTVKSEFRMFQDERVLSDKVKQSGDGWWHGFQHGIGVICHAAPAAWELGLSTIYFASSYTIADKGKLTCASDPTIDNFVRFGGTHIVHDGYEFTRQMKVHNITQFVQKTGMRIPLRVCWESKGGTNCCHCEKCGRTILEIYAENQDPHTYGFDYSGDQLHYISKKLRYENLAGHLRTFYSAAQEAMQKNCNKAELPKEIRWFYDFDINKLGNVPYWRKCARKLKRGLKKIIGGNR